MVRGRKKQENSLNKVLSIRITKEQKEIINNNNFIKKEIDNLVREHINTYKTK